MGRGEIVGEGGGVRCDGGVGRGTGVDEIDRGVGVGRVNGAGEPQCGLHKKPVLYCVRVLTKPATSLGSRNPLPTGGTTRSPMKASRSANVCSIQLPSAPLAMLSFDAIS